MSKISNIFLFLIIIGMFAAAYVMLIPPTWVVDKQLAAFKAGDISKAYGYTSAEFQKATSFEAFKEFVEQNPVLQDSLGMSINEELIDKAQDNALVVKGLIRNSEGNHTAIEYSITRENDFRGLINGWKIQTIKIQDQGEWKILPPSTNSSENLGQNP